MTLKNNKLRKNEQQFVPRNVEKYVGQYPIVCRSTWEYRYCQWLDANPAVLEWSSEGHCIKYLDPFNKSRTRRYYPDYYVLMYTRQGQKRFIVEVKPEKDLKPPKKKKNWSKSTKSIREQTYIINKAKFAAAQEYCKKMGYEFKVITEKNLFRSKR